MSDHDRLDVWNLLFVTKVNVCYWKSLIERHEKWRRRVQYWAFGITFVATVIILVINRNWATTVVTAISGFVVAVLSGPFLDRWTSREAKKAHESWSKLDSEAQRLWCHGEHQGWTDSRFAVRTAVLVERQKQSQAYEYHNPKTSVLQECEALIRQQMADGCRTEEQ